MKEIRLLFLSLLPLPWAQGTRRLKGGRERGTQEDYKTVTGGAGQRLDSRLWLAPESMLPLVAERHRNDSGNCKCGLLRCQKAIRKHVTFLNGIERYQC